MNGSTSDRIGGLSQSDNELNSSGVEADLDTLSFELASQVSPQESDVSEAQSGSTVEIPLTTLNIIEHPDILKAAGLPDASAFEDMDGYKQALLNTAWEMLWDHFEQSRSVGDLAMLIKFKCRVLQQIPENHPERAKWLSRLGVSYQYRFDWLGCLEDLDKAVEFNEEAVLLTPEGHPDEPSWLNNLGGSYWSLFKRLGRLDNIHKSVICTEQAVLLTPNDHPEKPGQLSNLGNSYHSLFERLGRLDDLHKSVSCKEQAVFLISEGHPHRPVLLGNLGTLYQSLFQRLGRLEDLHKSVSCKEEAVLLTPDGHPDKPRQLNNLGTSYQSLFERLGRLDDLHKSVSCKEQAAFLIPDGHPHKPTQLNNLGTSYQSLFQRLGRLDDMYKSVSCFEQAVLLTPHSHPDRPGWLNNLGNSYRSLFEHFGRLDDIQKSVSCKEQAVWLTPDSHPDKPGRPGNLGNSYRSLFEQLGRLQYAHQAISCLELAVLMAPVDHPHRALHLNELGTISLTMFLHSALPDHALHALDYLKHAALAATGAPSIRLRSSRNWARLSCWFELPPLEAYTQCMTLLPHVIWLAASVQDRYEWLSREVGILATEAATAAISLNRFDLALEWLEQGRSVVWGQTLQLRTPYDDLYAVNPEMAEELQYVSSELETASMSLFRGTAAGESMFETAWRHRWLAHRREELLDLARLLPGLENFLHPPKASEILSWVQDETTVIVNVDKLRGDALIIQAGAHTITHVTLARFSIQKAEQARAELACCLIGHGYRRGFKKGDRDHKPTFENVLAILWYDVVKPVLDHLGIIDPSPLDDLPHITWCTTGPLAFLPLHAAGDYSSPNTVLSNLAISSYTPTISSLKQPTSPSGTFSGILAVGHESAIAAHKLSPLPGTKDELDRIQEEAKSLHFTRLDEENACRDSVLKAMATHSWVHFACHASQDGCDPMKSALHLHDGDLDLTMITGNQLKNAQLAFLSACQTAAGDTALPDECIHLAAGLIMAGYPAVIATMWSINDRDAPLVAGEVYKCLLEGGVPDSRKAAKALHKAVASLRDTIGVDEFARWVPYIHIGR